MNKKWCSLLIICLVCGYTLSVSAATSYDINGDGKEGLAETIHSLQVVAGLAPETTPGTFTNSIGMTFNIIPAGSFTMGSPSDEPAANDNERPQHLVSLTKPFYMQTTEVTQAQWYALIVANSLGTDPSEYSGDDHPVEGVNWYEAASFANWLSFAEGKMICYAYDTCSGTIGNDFECTNVRLNPNCTGYRLPTEAEWEYAARATTTTAWSYAVSYDNSDDPGQVTDTGFNSNLDAMGWYYWNRTTQYAEGTKPVAKKQANKWGLYDMAGNVIEWCQDWYDGDYYSDPASTSDPQGPDTGAFSSRVIRGGSWHDNPRYARSAFRYSNAPGDRDFNNLGFRLVLPSGQ